MSKNEWLDLGLYPQVLVCVWMSMCVCRCECECTAMAHVCVCVLAVCQGRGARKDRTGVRGTDLGTPCLRLSRGTGEPVCKEDTSTATRRPPSSLAFWKVLLKFPSGLHWAGGAGSRAGCAPGKSQDDPQQQNVQRASGTRAHLDGPLPGRTGETEGQGLPTSRPPGP